MKVLKVEDINNFKDNILFCVDDERAFDCLTDAIESLLDMAETKEEALSLVIEVHKKQNYSHSYFISGKRIIEDAADLAYSETEYADGYLDDLSEEKKMEFNKLILDWLDENACQPNFYVSLGKLEEFTLSEEVFKHYEYDMDF